MPRYNNIFSFFLKRIKIKHTQYYADKLFNEHPHKNNLYGLSDMLTVYGIKNAGFRIESKEEIYNVTSPFVAYAGGSFVLVDAINLEQTNYYWNGKTISLATSDFLKIWSGIFLVAEPDEQSIEPDYQRNKCKQEQEVQ
jgi:ABC-type bacteriocin/lantibiotic exporter with double-glycine peptidase domain